MVDIFVALHEISSIAIFQGKLYLGMSLLMFCIRPYLE